MIPPVSLPILQILDSGFRTKTRASTINSVLTIFFLKTDRLIEILQLLVQSLVQLFLLTILEDLIQKVNYYVALKNRSVNFINDMFHENFKFFAILTFIDNLQNSPYVQNQNVFLLKVLKKPFENFKKL